MSGFEKLVELTTPGSRMIVEKAPVNQAFTAASFGLIRPSAKALDVALHYGLIKEVGVQDDATIYRMTHHGAHFRAYLKGMVQLAVPAIPALAEERMYA